MTVKVFATGVTGYIGGDAFYELATSHPDWDFTCIVRNSDKGAQVASQFPKVKLVYGDLDSVEILEEEAKTADIVLNCASADHPAAAEALVRGLSGQGRTSTKGYLLHTSGTGILMFKGVALAKQGGDAAERDSHLEIYDDWDGIDTVTSLPDAAPHRNVDKIIIAASSENLKTAIVCPPCIYGEGRGPGNKRSMQLPELARCTLEMGHGLQVRGGQQYWSNVHVSDLSRVFLKLAEYAVKDDSVPTWGPKGYYFTENGEQQWGDVGKKVANEAAKHDYIKSTEMQSLSDAEANKITHMGAFLWGANSRSRAIRARKLLGWEPKGKSLDDEISAVVESEAQKAGLKKGHAETVAA